MLMAVVALAALSGRADAVGTISIPAEGSVSAQGIPALKVTNTAGDFPNSPSSGLMGVIDAPTGRGVYGKATTIATGVWGESGTGIGVKGISAGGWPSAGVYGSNTVSGGTAVVGIGSDATSSYGIYGQGATMGVQGYATGTGPSTYGVSGVASGTGAHAIDAICNGSCATGGGYAGYFNGNGYVTGNLSVGSFTMRSDARLKKDIKDASYRLEQLMRLRPVTYRWKDGDDARLQTGFIAQEVQEIFPEFVTKDATSGMLSVNYFGLETATIKAVQEQQKTINDQRQVIRSFESRLAALEHGHLSGTPSWHSLASGTTLAFGLLPLGLVALFRRRK
jgi:hypothetical protein